VNLARLMGGDAEAALRGTNRKFARLFAWIEQALEQQGKTPKSSSLAEMDALWDAAKAVERKTAE
jgi:ATP diphosphatase